MCVKKKTQFHLIHRLNLHDDYARRPTALSNVPPFSILSDLKKYQWLSKNYIELPLIIAMRPGERAGAEGLFHLPPLLAAPHHPLRPNRSEPLRWL